MMTEAEPRTGRPRLVVGVGASAGGLDAARRLLGAMPTQSGMAVVIVMHLDPSHESHMAQLLQRSTQLPVIQAADTQPIGPDAVYIIAPDRSLEIREGVLLSTGPRAPHTTRKQVDTFFTSLAQDQRERAVAIILSGTGNNGSSGIQEIEALGGLCLVQDPATAEYDGMPESAIATGIAAHVLPPEDMPAVLVQHAEDPQAPRPERPTQRTEPSDAFDHILDLLSRTYGVNLRGSYKRGTLERRAQRRMGLKQLSDWQGYLELLQQDPAEVAALYRDSLIGVTEFFRDPALWEHLETEVIPRLVARHDKDRRPVKIWAPACATGEEPYSLAIAFIEQMERMGSTIPLQVFASDVAEHALAHARRASYPSSIQDTVSPERLARFFRREGDRFEIRRAVRDAITFTAHNLLADPPFSRLDMVSCRNLLIYLEPHAQQRALQLFHFALRPGGLLVLGASETVGRHTDLFQASSQKARIYESTASTEAARHHRWHWIGERSPMSPPSLVTAPPPSGPKVSRIIEQMVLSRFTSACVVITESFEIQSFFGPTHDYLVQPTGEVRMDLLSWAKPGLYSRLRSALERAVQRGERLEVQDMHVDRDGTQRRVQCTIEPITPLRGEPPLFLVAFRDAQRAPSAEVAEIDASDEPLVRQLETEVKTLREELQSSIEQIESANEESRASHEELLSLNEELQSNNEELEASKEELQSLNEEMVTINRQLEERNVELRTTNTDLNNLLTSTHIPIVFLDRDLRVRRFTPAATELMRLVSSDIGRSVEHIRERFHDGDLVGHAARVLERLIPITTELMTEDGGWYLRTVLPYRTEDDRIDGVCVAFQDITERKRAADEIDEARIYSEAIVSTVQTALVVLDHQLRVVSANDSFYEMFQVSRSETEGVLLYMLGNQQWNAPRLRALMEKVVDDTVVRNYEVEHSFERIGRRIMRLDASLMRRNSRPHLILLAIEDITELRSAVRIATARQEELVQEHHRKDEFLAMLGHELRNPLSALMHGLELLELSPGDAGRVDELRAMMTRQASRIGSMLDQLLDIARLTAGKLHMAEEPVAVADAVQAAAEAVEPLIEARNLSLKVTMPGRRAVVVRGDLMRLTQVVENLLNNAAKYTPEGGAIDLTVEASDDLVRIRVRDNGIGMDPEFLPRIFDLFVQEPRTLERASGGLGLGLALVKLAVEAHGGHVSVSSAGRGHGSEFLVTLPRLREATPVAAPDGAVSSALPVDGGRRILVVDDEEDAANALAEILAMKGHECVVAHDGRTAVEMARGFHPDVVLLDLGLPQMDGYEVARLLRQEQNDGKLVLVALTGYRKDAERIEQAGFDQHMIKPPDMRKLFAWLAAMNGERLK